jgi:diguanylate cyclase (GGDEF)-like protein
MKLTMERRARLLLIGAATLRDTLARALPGHELIVAEHPLGGVWKGGREAHDNVLVSLGVGSRALQVVSSLRRLSPEMRIIVSCTAPDEPLARRALSEGADDYILEPIRREDIQHAFHVTPTEPLPAARDPTGPSMEEIVKLGEVLRKLGDGVRPTLDRLAALLQETFDATGVTIQFDDMASSAGDASDPVLEEVIRHGETPIGRITLGRRARGTYAAGTAARLSEYARLIEATAAQARERQRWRQLAWTDDLSTLHNRRYFEHVVDELIEKATEKRLRVTVLLFDIDDFKSYNDAFGHETGDKLIQEVARLLKTCTRERDVVVRYGGDEFAVVFWDAEKQRVPGSEHPREPMALATRFCKAIAEHDFECLGSAAPGPVTISGGLACFPWNGRTREVLMAAADEALLAAKRTGKNCIHLAGSSDEE